MSSSIDPDIRSTERTGPANLVSVLAGLDELPASTDLAVVFGRIAELCVAELADECLVTFSDSTGSELRVARPVRPAAGGDDATPATWAELTLATDAVAVPIQPRGLPTGQGFSGSLVLRWRGARQPSAMDAAVARVVGERASAVVSAARLAEELRREQVRASNLEIALASNREIGTAIGILMARDLVTSEQAFDRLRQASQVSHRKLREIASEVIFTGRLDDETPGHP